MCLATVKFFTWVGRAFCYVGYLSACGQAHIIAIMRHKSYALQVGRHVISLVRAVSRRNRSSGHKDHRRSRLLPTLARANSVAIGLSRSNQSVFACRICTRHCSADHIIERDVRPRPINHLKRFISSDSMSPFTYSTAGLK